MTRASGTAEEQRAIAYLQWTGWLQDHDKQIYEQGKRDGIDERKTGIWKEYVDYGNHQHLFCSVCKRDGYKTRFCSNCGAKMKGAEE